MRLDHFLVKASGLVLLSVMNDVAIMIAVFNTAAFTVGTLGLETKTPTVTLPPNPALHLAPDPKSITNRNPNHT